MSDIKRILENSKSIAMIGVSNDLKKPSTIVMKYMQDHNLQLIGNLLQKLRHEP